MSRPGGAAPPQATRRRTPVPSVLVIEDEAFLRDLFRKVLEEGGFEVREAGDVAGGVKAYAERPADVVVCDVFLPDGDGLHAIGALRRLDPGARVLAISGSGGALFGGQSILSAA